jgi:predicted nucleic acid-binding Zn finger protein
MDKKTELDILHCICKQSKENGKLTGKDLTKLHETFGERFIKAFEALKEHRVKKYIFEPSGKVVWIVVGKKKDYLLMPEAGFCSCDDFYFRVMDREVHLCYHLIAQKIANILKGYDSIKERDELHDSLMKEWKNPTP